MNQEYRGGGSQLKSEWLRVSWGVDHNLLTPNCVQSTGNASLEPTFMDHSKLRCPAKDSQGYLRQAFGLFRQRLCCRSLVSGDRNLDLMTLPDGAAVE